MAGTQPTAGACEVADLGELRAFHTQLTALAKTACAYPLEYALGSYELLFETRNDIETIAANLVESIADLRHAA
jgi:hypothetical protein